MGTKLAPSYGIRMKGHGDHWDHVKFERSPFGEHLFLPGHYFISHASACCMGINPEWTDKARKVARATDDTSFKPFESKWRQQRRLISNFVSV